MSDKESDKEKDREKTDSMGTVTVPEGSLWGAQTQRAINNFDISGRAMPSAFIEAVLLIKASAAHANHELELLSSQQAHAIQAACETARNQHLHDQFPVDVMQTGSGTSTNMNVNEVLATLASRELDEPVHANDHVNMSQSSNDVIPTAIRVATVLAAEKDLLPALQALITAIDKKADEYGEVIKTGRTHLMDALPISMGQVFSAWQTQLSRAGEAVQHALVECHNLPQGGTAIGTGLNAPDGFAAAFVARISELSGSTFKESSDKVADISAQDTLVTLSAALRTCAVVMTKVANDLRWMSSGPLAGLGEITLPALQPGSSIMPGKVNPVIPEGVLMASAQVMGNDHAVALAGQSGNFELNVMLPLIGDNLLASIGLLARSANALAEKAIVGLTVNKDHVEQALHKNPILVTALNQRIGYDQAAEIAKLAYRSGRTILEVAVEQTDIAEEELRQLLDPRQMT